MTTRLDNNLRREITAEGKPYTVILSPLGLKVVPKGKRNGVELTWASLVNGDAALAVALNASTLKLASEPKPQARQRTER